MAQLLKGHNIAKLKVRRVCNFSYFCSKTYTCIVSTRLEPPHQFSSNIYQESMF